MRRVRVVNRARGVCLAEAGLATSFWARGWGLLGHATLPEGDGLVIDPAGSIHTFFMRFPIDVLHVARDNTVCRILHSMQPYRLGPVVWRSRYVVELPAGTARRTGTQVGDLLALETLGAPGAER